ncbi:MAG TPA: hypothetical protein VEK11_03795 [Thermoanaerobaculia bacterium]|nr:hypothetical protein [Thermoanaerobaculia bacterium]
MQIVAASLLVPAFAFLQEVVEPWTRGALRDFLLRDPFRRDLPLNLLGYGDTFAFAYASCCTSDLLLSDGVTHVPLSRRYRTRLEFLLGQL